MNLGFIRQYLGEVPPDRTFTAKELWEVFNAFAPLMTKEQEKKMVDNLKNLLETHTVKEGGYENEPCYQRECSNPSKHINGLHIGSEREVKEEPTTPENKCWNCGSTGEIMPGEQCQNDKCPAYQGESDKNKASHVKHPGLSCEEAHPTKPDETKASEESEK